MNEQDHWEAAAGKHYVTRVTDLLLTDVEVLTRHLPTIDTGQDPRTWQFPGPALTAMAELLAEWQELRSDPEVVAFAHTHAKLAAFIEHGYHPQVEVTAWQLDELPDRVRTSIEHTRNVGGRPAIGPRVHVALPEAVLEKIEAEFGAHLTRSQAIRTLVEAALYNEDHQKNVTRFEVIDWEDNEGRVLVRNPTRVELSYQDEGRTLKVFLRGRDES